MTKIVIVMNCIGRLIELFLKKSININKSYEIHRIYNVDYLHDNAKYNDIDKNKLKDADILILQYIRDGIHEKQPNFEKWYNRGIINHEYIINNFKKNNAKIILIPHYTYNANLYVDELIKQKVNGLKDNLSFQELYCEISNILNNILYSNNIEIQKAILYNEHKDNLHLQKLDETCTLNMYEFIHKNNKHLQLFQSRHHAKTYLIINMTTKILDYLDIKYNDEYNNFENNNISESDEHCVFKFVSKTLNLEYDSEEYIINKYKSLVYYFILTSKFMLKLKDILYLNKFLDKNYTQTTIFQLVINNEKVRELLIEQLNKFIIHY